MIQVTPEDAAKLTIEDMHTALDVEFTPDNLEVCVCERERERKGERERERKSVKERENERRGV